MKIIYILLISFGLFSTSFLMNSQEVNPGTKLEQQPIKKKRVIDAPNQSKMPSLIIIYFAYDAITGSCIFTLPADVEYIDIELINESTQISYYGSANAIDYVWHQTLTSGEYYIVCTTDNGDIYSGYIYI